MRYLCYNVCISVMESVVMIRKDKKQYKTGVKTHVRVVEGYRENGKIKQRTIKSFGSLEDQIDQEKFMQMVKDFDDNYFL